MSHPKCGRAAPVVHGTAAILSVRRCLFGAALAMALATGSAWAGGMGPINSAAPKNQIAPNAPFLVHGKRVDLRSFRGQPLMLWQVTTWCSSCRAGLELMARKRIKALIDASNIRIIVLRDYKNGGYPGDSMSRFAGKAAPALLHDPHFVFGKDTATLFKLYNPHHYVDVYQLISAVGNIATVSSTPTASVDKIIAFIKSQAKS